MRCPVLIIPSNCSSNQSGSISPRLLHARPDSDTAIYDFPEFESLLHHLADGVNRPAICFGLDAQGQYFKRRPVLALRTA